MPEFTDILTRVPGGQPVRFERQSDVGMIVIDNSPVNAGSHAVRRGIVSALEQATHDEAVNAVVLVGAGGSFISGSDVKEFTGEIADPSLPDVIRAVEMCPHPVVAALDGFALGGGLELALACDYRVATTRLMVGLPEVTLGMVPGAGGTQRLPRVVGRLRAIDLIASGRKITAAEALEWGIVSEVVSTDKLISAATALLAEVDGKQPLSAMTVPIESSAEIDRAAAAATKKARSRPAAVAAIDLVQRSATEPFAGLITEERRTFNELRLSDEAAALRHLFFAERSSAKIPELKGVQTRNIALVGVVGAGTMGASIAEVFVSRGYEVIVADFDGNRVADAVERIRASADIADEGIHGTTDIADLRHCDLVIEAIIEDLAAKSEVFAQLEQLLASDAILATNTSYLDINALAADLDHPDRVLGMHFFNPAAVMPLVEIIRTSKASSETVATGLAIARHLKKTPIVAQVAEGFVANRMFAAYRRHCEYLLLDGASPRQVDDAMRSFGFRQGPFATADSSGLDIAWAMRKRVAATRDSHERYVEIPDVLCEAGRFGRKTGAGYYRYVEGQRHGKDDAFTASVIQESRKRHSTAEQIAPSAEQIAATVVAAIANEALLLIEEGVARSASDVDVAAVNGFGFPRHRGGPLFWARQQGSDFETLLLGVEKADGVTHRRGDLDLLL